MPSTGRPCVSGKFLILDDDKFHVRGVTYGTFRPNPLTGEEFPEPGIVRQDFAQMAEIGLNAVRTYTVPPRWLLDNALQCGLRVMVGLPWEQHIAFLEDRERPRDIERRVREGVRSCAGHPAVLCYSIGNEIPAPIVRWHGASRIERFLRRLFDAAKAEDPGALVTYVSYPTTEYLDLPFLDFVTFNVYLESPDRYSAYLARLQNLAGNRPLVMAEIGLDSRRNGELAQARSLDWQVRASFTGGCAGAFVFSWTDEWYRGGYDIDDWDFGLTDRERNPKPAMETVSRAFLESPFIVDHDMPRITVIVCTCNGERTLPKCLAGLQRLRYPNYEVIVVDDGSTDSTAHVASEFDVQLITTSNRGLSSARNTGLYAANGDIVAYIDDDAVPDPGWLHYLASTFRSTDHVGVGGPNIPPPDDMSVAKCVANAPGGPIHVLITDTEAEHIPGCNMAFDRKVLLEIGGFDPRFRTAGDDVDICWRIRDQGYSIGFNPAAMVWHRRRGSVRAYLKQQIGYGRAEAMLEEKWPERYNAVGHLTWEGRLYGPGSAASIMSRRNRIYHGTWGSAPFQSVYQPAGGLFSSLTLMPERYVVVFGLAFLAALGLTWSPLLFVAPLFLVATLATVAQAYANTAPVLRSSSSEPTGLGTTRMRLLTLFLHLVQPVARLYGRVKYGLTPFRWTRRSRLLPGIPWPAQIQVWREEWKAPEAWLEDLESSLRSQGGNVRRGSDFDRWDLEVCGGLFGTTRILCVIEEHGGGKQLARLRSWPVPSSGPYVMAVLFGVLAVAAYVSGAWVATLALTVLTVWIIACTVVDCGAARAMIATAFKQSDSTPSEARVLASQYPED